MSGLTPDQLARSGNEFGEQSALFCWVALSETRRAYPDAIKLYANYNNAGVDGDAKTAAIRGARAKQAGLRSGVADVFLPVPRHGRNGLYIEMKIDPTHPENQRFGKRGQPIEPKRGALSEDQAKFGRQAIADGYGWAMAEGWKQAADIIRQYLTP